MFQLERSSLIRRFAVIGAIALLACAVPSAQHISSQWHTMASARLEASSAAPLESMFQLVRLTQQHRGLAALALAGQSASVGPREAKQREADGLWTRASEVLAKAPLSTQTQQAWRGAAQTWAQLHADIGSARIDGAASFARHSTLIAQLVSVIEMLSEDHGLPLDPDLGHYQLIRAAVYELPALTEHLGRARAQGSGMLATGRAGPAERQTLEVSVALAENRLTQMRAAFDKAATRDAELRAAVAPAMEAAVRQSEVATTLARREIIETPSPSLPAPQYTQQFTTAIDAQFGVATVALDRLANRLSEQADAERNRLLALLAGLAALVGLGLAAGVAVSRSITRQIGGEPGRVIAIAEAIAGGDLSRRIDAPAGAAASIVGAMARMQQSLVGVVTTVRDNAESVAAGSTQIAQGNQDLSNRTELQASSLQRTAATMEELDGTVRRNADNAREADRLAGTASEVASRGGEAVAQVVETMKGIEDSSSRIAEIIGTIDGIAFQTNILALNAAVEAARAGEQGRGFAVVAGEVRALAQRAAAAASEIKALIGTSVERVGQGSALVDRAGATMREVVDSIRRVSTLMGEISVASNEQSQGVAQVGQAVGDIDRSTQQNAALVEESAAAAASLQQQAQRLRDAVSVFRVAA